MNKILDFLEMVGVYLPAIAIGVFLTFMIVTLTIELGWKFVLFLLAAILLALWNAWACIRREDKEIEYK